MKRKIWLGIAFVLALFFLTACLDSKYEVVFKDYSGAILKTTSVKSGLNAEAPEDPVRDGYDFVGWSVDFNNVTGNLEVKAEYEVKKYAINFFVDGVQVGETQKVAYRESAILPDAPVKEGCTFTGWVGDYTNVTKAADIEAAFDINVYKVMFKDFNGYTIQESYVRYGEGAVAPDEPTREGYDFDGWSKTFNNITSDLVVIAKYNPKSYKVTFYVDEDIYGIPQTITHGEDATLPDEPVKDGYTFVGWSNYKKITANTSVKAEFQINKYQVTFKDDNGAILKVEFVLYGASATAPTIPTKEGHTWKGWDQDFDNIEGDLEVKATYNIIKYDIDFYIDGVKEGETQKVNYGEDAIPPVVEAVAGKTFTGWTGAYTNVKASGRVDAAFDVNIYKVIFRDYNDYIIKEEMVAHGEDANPPLNLNKEGYNFDGWKETDYKNITASKEIKATYTIKSYTVKFYNWNLGDPLKVETVDHGASATAPSVSERDGYTFTGWDYDFSFVTSDLNMVVAQFTINEYLVQFKDYNNYIIKEEMVEHGEDATPPAAPVRDGYDFDGWQETDYKNITASKEIKATYTIKSYTVKFYNWNLGDPLKVETVDHGASATAPSVSERDGYTFTGWDYDFSFVTSDLNMVVAQFTINEYLVQFKDYNNYIIKEEMVEHGEDATPPAAPVRDGYDFDGWQETDYKNITASKEIKATYTIKSYTITYNTNGGVVYDDLGDPINEVNLSHGTVYELPLPVKEGYTFVYWKCGLYYYEALENYTVLNNATLVAQWAVEQDFVLSFDSNGGSAVASQVVRRFDYIESLETPTRDGGWTFVGWSYNSQIVQAPFRYEYDKNVVLLALWTMELSGMILLDEAPSDGITVTKYVGTQNNFTVPLDVGGEYITKIADNAFKNNTTLETLILPEEIKKVGNNAFANMSNLKTIEFSNTTKEIGYSILAGSISLMEFQLSSELAHSLAYYFGGNIDNVPANMTIVYSAGGATIDKTLTQNPMKNAMLVLAGGTTEIAENQFAGCNGLERITIPSSVQTINQKAFYNAINLTTVTFESVSLLEGIGGETFANCKKLTNIDLSDNSSLDEIGGSAFYGCEALSSIAISDSVTAIGLAAFGGCSTLESITTPFIGKDSTGGISGFDYTLGYFFGTVWFEGSYQVGDIYYPSSLKKIDVTNAQRIATSAFNGAKSLEEVSINDGVNTMGAEAFKGCVGLTKLSLPFVGKNNDTSDPDETRFGYIFGKTSYGEEGEAYLANDFYIPTSLTNVIFIGTSRIPAYAFTDCTSLTSIVFNEDLLNTLIGNFAFSGCSNLPNFAFPSNVVEIGAGAFRDCTLLGTVPFEFPSLLETIGNSSCKNCQSLTQIKFDSNNICFTSIWNEAFMGCTLLTDITLPETTTTMGDGVFMGATALEEIYIPKKVAGISASLFEGCSNLATVTFAEDSETGVIGDYAFKECVDLTSIIIPNSVMGIGISAFEGCSTLATVTFVDVSKVNAIGSSAFKECIALGAITIPKSVESINMSAFEGCTILDTVTFAESSTVNIIRPSAFKGCIALASISFPDSLEEIDSSAFEGCTNLTTVTFKETSTLSAIRENAFKNCAFTSFECPSTVAIIEQAVFSGCAALEYIKLPFVGKSASATNQESRFGYIFGTDQYTGGYSIPAGEGITTFCIPSVLETVVIETGIQNVAIAGVAFEGCYSIKSLTIRNRNLTYTVTSIGEGALKGCYGLEEISVPFVGKNKTTTDPDESRFGYIFGKSSYGSAGTTTYSANGFYLPLSLTSVTITSETQVRSNAFKDCISFVSIVFEAEISDTLIYNYAFAGCTALETMILPRNTKKIGENVFNGCTALVSIQIPNLVEEIHGFAFGSCTNLTTVIFTEDSKLKLIKTSAFQDCGLTSFIVPSSLSTLTIDEGAFNGCAALEYIKLPFVGKACGSTGRNARLGHIFGTVFYEGSYEVPSGEVGINFYIPSSLQTVEIVVEPAGYIYIGSNVFEDCYSIKSITVEKDYIDYNLDFIEVGAFKGCYGLEEIALPFVGYNIWSVGPQSQFGYVFGFSPYQNSYEIPSSKGAAYYYYIPNGLKSIKIGMDASSVPYGGEILTNAFDGLKSVESLDLASSQVAIIQAGALKGMSALVNLNLPFIASRFGEFFGTVSYGDCYEVPSNTGGINYYIPSSLQNVIIKNNKLIEINSYTFENCYSIKSLSIGQDGEGLNVWYIDEGAFKGCYGLEEITLPYIGRAASTSGLETRFGFIFGTDEYSYSYTVPTGEAGVFYIPTNLKTIKVGAGSASSFTISSNAFEGITSVEHLDLSSSKIQIIEEGALKGMSGLVTLKIPFTGKSSTATNNECDFGFIFGSVQYDGSYEAVRNETISYYIPSSLVFVEITDTSLEFNTILSGVFSNCSSLTHVVIPETIDYVSSYVFDGCYALTIYVARDADESGIIIDWEGNWNYHTDSTQDPIPYYYNYGAGWIYGEDGFPIPVVAE